ncbi:hypothetical protein ScPMuIL_012881 [Solemya velum]
MDPVLAVGIILSLDKRERKRKQYWSKRWFLRKQTFGHAKLLDELRLNQPEDFRNFLRMDEESFNELLWLITPLIEKKDTIMRKAISPMERLLITLRYLASGNTFEDLKFPSAISPQTIGRIVIETCEAIISCLDGYIKIPCTEDEWRLVSKDFEFHWNFPHCLGIDGKHIAIKKPAESESFYFNYKKFFSIVLMAVVNAKYEFVMVDVGVNGRVSDGGIINSIKFGRRLHDKQLNLPKPEVLVEGDIVSMPYVFVADDAFAMTKNLLKPYSQTHCKLNDEKRVFNYRLSRARRVVENAFGILSSRFGVFQRQMFLSPEKAATITLTCCYLHNFLRRKSRTYLAGGSADWMDGDRELHERVWRESQTKLTGLLTTTQRNSTSRAKLTREASQNYFCTRGMVPCQLNRI